MLSLIVKKNNPCKEIFLRYYWGFRRWCHCIKAVGKVLPSNIYYERWKHVLDKKHKPNSQIGASKILREVQFISKVIFCIENFNKSIVLLAKKTDRCLANFVRIGATRNIRVKTFNLKAAIDRTPSLAVR